MPTLYPFSVLQARDPGKAKEEHAKAVGETAAEISQAIFDQLPFLTDVTFQRRSTAYAGTLAQLILHVPQSDLAQVTHDLISAANELLMMEAKNPPRAFELVCTAGYHIALPGGASFAKISPPMRGLHQKRGVYAADEVTEDIIETVMQRAERRLEWINLGRPDDRNPRILKHEAGPEESFIEDAMNALEGDLEEKDRLEWAQTFINYIRTGQQHLRARKIRWDRQKGN